MLWINEGLLLGIWLREFLHDNALVKGLYPHGDSR